MRRIAIVVSCSVVTACGTMDSPTAPTSVGLVAFSAGQEKTTVCHYDANADAFFPITIAEPAIEAHIAHGDRVPGAALSNHSALFDSNCAAVSVALSSSAYSTAIHGGSGGTAFTLNCPSGSVAIGMEGFYGPYVYGGTWVGRVRLLCAELLGDGTPGATSWTSYLGSGTAFSSQTQFSASCASGSLLTGGSGYQGPYVSQVGGNCASAAQILGGSAVESTIGPWGVVGASAFNASCSAGSAVTGLKGRAYYLVDAIGFTCTELTQQPL